ncbi:uncharacterized protein MONOS_1528 [Monocercomonoides exilis]|uniref:uncharacterized protein n=1 Tax=Monocercomonoides exilis TaxID=2049356 RepID=UPI00355AAF13|nr:hypothetical protein MONOS_1528 [Monocercomonoides exilis]|eukprot:MONOS_1528.1-p1 / transcript=MONOS_1528.1 / gene=MONOS_1528 / organism=Monocercomonoides_exilis_PA203 / gene_product=unspecified product / transcript_product=unspecified product / location=Mono_scaffold00027:81014-82171(+) / protein_length=386 / sequence_SO=supercontig / SO=protein_coding / is_pseudo=false
MQTSDIYQRQLRQTGTRNLVFDSASEMQTWIDVNKGNLVKGQLILIKGNNVPDYWWDGTALKKIECDVSEVSVGGLNEYYKAVQIDNIVETCEKIENKGQANGYVPLDNNGKIASSYLTISEDMIDLTGIELEGYEKTTNKDKANGYAGLDESGKLSVNVLPDELSEKAGTSNPLMDGSVNVGTSDKYAREDHIHPSDSSKANDESVVHLSGTETITGSKTFSNAITTSAVPTNIYHLVTKQYVDNKVGAVRIPTSEKLFFTGNSLLKNTFGFISRYGELATMYVRGDIESLSGYDKTAWIQIGKFTVSNAKSYLSPPYTDGSHYVFSITVRCGDGYDNYCSCSVRIKYDGVSYITVEIKSQQVVYYNKGSIEFNITYPVSVPFN